ncbi:cytochrome P450-dit2 [Puccinia graminis f. sp. tritici]|uniref:Cytochrome P450-dit2 n=1 Tax=Puccinia graminis f. sp. tritici TaxID=56615 RepID=A0A5B0PF31_PUCGR|nr:cytochrome P450-dit2 [Puccinia graminis f. sp. tritici]KAA1104832.1 cytochrome P450-dit2 [Puccinia graminis f. sp. tritici]
MITFLFANLLAYSLVYLLIKFRTRAIGTTKRKDTAFYEVPGWPLIGQLPMMFKNRTRNLEDNTVRALEHGPGFSITVPGIRIVDISKPEWIEHMQKTNFENYVKGPLLRGIMYDVFGDGIFVADGPAWKRARQATSTIFTIKTFKNIIVPAANKSLDGLVDLLKSTAQSNDQSIDFCDLFFRYTLDSFVQMTFGQDLDLFGTQYDGKTKGSSPSKLSASSLPFSEAFDFAQDQVDFRFSVVIGWKLLEGLVGSIGKRMKASCRVLDDYAYSLIDERMASRTYQSNLEKNEAVDGDLLGLFMNARDERGGGLGRTELRDTTLNLIIAGRDTTAEALSWAFFHLLMNEDLISKIREEAIEILGDENDGQERVTHENYKRFVWTNAIVLETLRLHPSVPKNTKCVVSHDQIPGGPTVEAGDIIRWSGWQMGRDASLWGPDCGEFKPARWVDEKGSIKQFGPYKFNAFNGGPRICLGMNLAMLQAVKVIVELFRHFELEFAPGWLEKVPKSEAIEGITSRYPTPMYRSSLTLPMDNPMMVSVKCKA